MTIPRLKIAWVALLTIAFLWFSAWYGGSGKPISAEEGERLLEQVRQAYPDADSSERRFLSNLQEMIPRDDGKEFYAVNLEDLKEGPEARQSDRAYAKVVMPLLFKRAGHPVFVSNRAGLMLGQYGNQVDRVAVVRYRSLRDMIEMAIEPAMQAGEVHKFGALNHTEVFITRPTISFVHVRVTLALVLIIIGWLGMRGLSWLNRRQQSS